MNSIHSFLNASGNLLRKLSFAFGVAGAAALALLLILVCANIVLRPLGHSIRGTLEMSGYLGALSVGLCMPLAQTVGSHITAGLFASSLPQGFSRLEIALVNLICASLFFLLARQLTDIGFYVVEMGEYIDGFGFSYLPMLIGFAAGIVLHAALFVHAALAAVFRYPCGGNPL